MLIRLKYDVKFQSTGKVLKGDIRFDQGLSGISGPNEAGKSTVLELIRFALFGSAALRAAMKEYISIETTLDWKLKGEDWQVKRTKTTAELRRADRMIATGTTPVNQKIEKLFGYGLTVFDIAHFCGQGKVEALTDMKPTERKQMVDRTIGLDALDVAAKNAGDNRTTLAAELKGLKAGMGSKPVEPACPWDYRPSEMIAEKIEEAEPLLSQFLLDQAWLAEPEPVEPVEPVAPGLPPAAKIREHCEARQRVLDEAERLRKLVAGIPAPIYTSDQLDKLEAQFKACCEWMDQCTFVDKVGEFPWWVTPAQLKQVQTANALRAEIAELEASIQAREAGKVTCPECKNEFDLSPEDLGRLRFEQYEVNRQLELLWEVPDFLSDWQAAMLLHTHNAWAGRKIVPWVPMPPVNDAVIAEQRRAIATEPARQALAALVIPQDHSAELRQQELYEMKYELWVEATENYWRHINERAARRRRLTENQGIQAFMSGLRVAKEEALDYETRIKVWADEALRYEALSAKVAELTEETEQWQRASDAIKTLRTKVKTYLVPSLNTAASQLLSLMTGGTRSSIQISEDFEKILVDGQPVETLSGSAKAVANLSIRLGLGRVLTNSVFSVFMGDEIDASMDSDRAGYTAACLASLGSVIGQIILVSHKDLEVQHHIKIG